MNAEKLRKQGELIALHLGRPWKFNALDEPSDHCFELIDGEGRSLFFRKEYGSAKKYRIHGTFKAAKTGRHSRKCPSIGVSYERDAKAIARDVARRLLPEYLIAFDNAVLDYHDAQAREAKKELVKQALLKVTGGYCVAHRGDSVFFKDGEARCIGGVRVDLELKDLTPDQAIRIAAMVTEERKRQEAGQ